MAVCANRAYRSSFEPSGRSDAEISVQALTIACGDMCSADSVAGRSTRKRIALRGVSALFVLIAPPAVRLATPAAVASIGMVILALALALSRGGKSLAGVRYSRTPIKCLSSHSANVLQVETAIIDCDFLGFRVVLSYCRGGADRLGTSPCAQAGPATIKSTRQSGTSRKRQGRPGLPGQPTKVKMTWHPGRLDRAQVSYRDLNFSRPARSPGQPGRRQGGLAGQV